MRISTGLRARGASTERWAKWRERTRKIVAMRARGRCELTGLVSHEGLDVHHLLDRDAEPWSSHPLAVIAVSRQAHNDLENELLPALHDELRRGAVAALAAEYGQADWYRLTLAANDEPLAVWRRLVDRLNGLGFRYDEARNAIVEDES